MPTDPPPAIAPVQPGDVLAGKYRVERILGAGGMGVVVAATHIQLDQVVALKFLLPTAVKNPKVVARFEREARAVVKLRSANVARVTDVGTLDDGSPYIVMEYLEGLDLGQLIDTRGRLAIDQAVDYILQTCEALAEAHGNGIIHRDLKPQNLFLTRGVDGNDLVKVLDFGISKLEGGAETLSLTHTAEVVGSPNYMSPEQLRSARFADARSDIWSLGVILFELLTALMPFEAETLPHLSALIISEPPRNPTALRPDVPRGLEAIVLRCLEKEPAKRFGSVVELAAALEPYALSRNTGAAQRVRAVATARSSSSSGENPVVRGSVPAVRGASQNTSIGWDQTALANTKRSPAPIILGVGSAFLVVLLAGAWFLFRSATPPHPTTAADADSASVTPTTTATDSASATPTVPSAGPTTTTSVVTTATVKPPKPNATNRPGHPVVKPKPGELDDLPSERN